MFTTFARLFGFFGRTSQGFRQHVRRVVVLVVLVVAVVHPALADSGPTLNIKRTLVLDRVGDAHVTLQLKMPTALYTQLKQNTPNIAVLLRRLGNGQSWAEIDDVQGKFEDMKSTVLITYTHRGMARPIGKDKWEVPVEADGGIELVGLFDNVAIFTSAASTPLGLAMATERLEAPEGSSELKLDERRGRMTYRFSTASPESAGSVDVDFRLEAKDQLMSCLAKAYANSQFSSLWAARVVFRNTGDVTLRDYRVRFRIQNYSSWSRWMSARRVVPGQTVVDAFFPVFDLDKLSRLNGTRPISIEVEYEYKTPDGEVVRETDYRSLELLGRNEVIFSSLPAGEAVGFHDYFDYGPLLLAAFVSRDDPVIQQLAGRVSGLAGGAAASLSDEDAIKYLKALWDFLNANGLAYQTPPNNVNQGQFGQHVKFARDVLRNRAGTCIDLAILFGSAAEAVGLEPILYLVPGHCFPVIRLRSGAIIPIEATAIGRAEFAQAVDAGREQLEKALRSRLFYAVDITEMHNAGVRPLELPPVEPDYLEKLGYRFQLGQSQRTQASHQQQHSSSTPAATIAGKWVADQAIGSARVQIATYLGADGRYATVLRIINNGTVQEYQETGQYRLNGNTITLVAANGAGSTTRRFRLRGDVLEIEVAEWNTWVVYRRVE